MLKAGVDKLATRALVGATGLVAMIVPAAQAGLPTAAYAPWLTGATALHIVYQLVLIRSYEASDFSIAFPVARGMVPLATAGLGVTLLGERLPATAMGGIALTTLGIVGLAHRRMSAAGFGYAVLAGLFTTVYTLVDAQGIRRAPDALAFIAWFFVLDGIIMPALFLAARRRNGIAILRRQLRPGIVAGLVSLVGFGSTLWALRLAPVGAVSALRETSVLVSLLVAATTLGERLDRRRICCALLIAAGAAIVFASVAGEGTGG